MKNEREIQRIRAARPALINGIDNGRDDIIRVLQHFCVGGRGSEIGTFNGTFAGEIMHRTAVDHLTCVDPWKSYEDFHDAINTMDLEAVFQQAQRFLAPYASRVSFLRTTSAEALPSLSDASLDFAYIDGNHQFAFVFADLEGWWPKLKPGGLLLGDDAVDLPNNDHARDDKGDVRFVHQRADNGEPILFGDYGVHKAVRTFCEVNDLGFILTGTQYIIPKPAVV